MFSKRVHLLALRGHVFKRIHFMDMPVFQCFLGTFSKHADLVGMFILMEPQVRFELIAYVIINWS